MGIAECAATAAGTDTEGRGEEGGLSEGAAPGCVREDGAQRSARPTVSPFPENHQTRHGTPPASG